jgi:uncharacterized protein (UPF0332 family)
MSLNDENRRLRVNDELEKAYEAMTDAEVLVERERWNGAAGRFYYALFHAVTALLIHDAHPVKSHKGALRAFGQHYVITGKVPAEYGVLFSQFETLREGSDYTGFYRVKPETLMQKIPQAHEMIDTIADMVKEINDKEISIN